MSNEIQHIDIEYTEWVAEVKQRYRNAQLKAAVKVNSEKLLFNWLLGADLVLKKAEERWGEGIVEKLSKDLQTEFPGADGFTPRNLWLMKQWYLFYSQVADTIKLKQAVSVFEEYALNHQLALNQIGQTMVENEKLKQAVSQFEEYSTQNQIAISQIASYSAANTKTKQAVSQFPNLFAPLIAG